MADPKCTSCGRENTPGIEACIGCGWPLHWEKSKPRKPAPAKSIIRFSGYILSVLGSVVLMVFLVLATTAPGEADPRGPEPEKPLPNRPIPEKPEFDATGTVCGQCNGDGFISEADRGPNRPGAGVKVSGACPYCGATGTLNLKPRDN